MFQIRNCQKHKAQEIDILPKCCLVKSAGIDASDTSFSILIPKIGATAKIFSQC